MILTLKTFLFHVLAIYNVILSEIDLSYICLEAQRYPTNGAVSDFNKHTERFCIEAKEEQ